MGKDINGNELGRGICQRKDGRYEYRRLINGQRISYYSFDYNDILQYDEYIENSIINKNNFEVFHGRDKKVIKLDELSVSKEFKKYSNSLKQNEGYVYFISNGQYCKIGHAIDLKKRIDTLQCGSPYKLEIIKTLKSIDYINLENQLHNLFSKYRVLGEWYDILFLFKEENNNEERKCTNLL